MDCPNLTILYREPHGAGTHRAQGATKTLLGEGPTDHHQKRLTFGPIWRWLQAALITCLTLSSDELAFANCKYNIKNGMAPLHSYRNGELIQFL